MGSKYKILDVDISVTNLKDTYQQILQWIEVKRQAYICIAPVSTIVDCRRDPAYRAVVNGAGMVTPDGMPLVWLGRLKGFKNIERTCGSGLMPYVCNQGQDKGLRHFFYGGTPETLLKLSSSLMSRFTSLQIAGTHAPEMQPVGQVEAEKIIEKINRAKPDILWVGLGSPKQDFWMANHRDQLDVPIMVGVGAAFDFLSGMKLQAPKWIQRGGLEWLFRLLCEPRRLWKRYLVGNTLFIYWIIKDYCVRRFHR